MDDASGGLRLRVGLSDLLPALADARVCGTALAAELPRFDRAVLWSPEEAASPDAASPDAALIVVSAPVVPRDIALLRAAFDDPAHPRSWALCGWSDDALDELTVAQLNHGVLHAPRSDAAEVIAAVARSAEPPHVAELRRLTSMQRSLSQALEQPQPVAEILQRLHKLSGAVCVVVDGQGRAQESVGSIPLSLFLTQIRRTDADVQQVQVEGWFGRAIRLQGSASASAGAGGWLVLASRRADFPSMADTAAAHIAATLIESAWRIERSAQQQEHAIRSSIFDEALALSLLPESTELASRVAALGFDFGQPLRVMVAAPGSEQRSRVPVRRMQQPLRAALDAAPLLHISTYRDSHGIYLVQASGEALQRLLTIERSSLGAFAVGIGREVTRVSDIPRSHADGLIALRALRAGRHRTNHMVFEQFDFATRLFASVDLEQMAESSRALLGPLIEREPMLQTLRLYFQVAQNTNAAAATLGIHHNTLRYRLTKVEELLQIDLNDPSAIASIHLALTSLDLVENPERHDAQGLRPSPRGIPLAQAAQRDPVFGATRGPEARRTVRD